MNKVDLFTDGDLKLAEHAEVIRALGKRAVHDIIEIGRRLIEAKAICGHGNWLTWLEHEFGWTDKTAQNFMSVANAAGKFENFSNLNLPISGLYLLAAPSTPAEVIEVVAERSEQGERLSLEEVKKMVAEAEAKSGADAKARLVKLEAEYAEREKLLRAEFEAAHISKAQIKKMIAEATQPLRDKIAALKEKAKREPVRTAPLGLESVVVQSRLQSLAEAVSKITPDEFINNYRQLVAITGTKTAAEPFRDDLTHVPPVLSWLTRFNELGRQAAQEFAP